MDAGVKAKKSGGPVERGRKGSESGAASTIKSVGIIGAGQMGNGIAHVVSLAGLRRRHVRPEEGGGGQGSRHHRAQHDAPGLARHHHRCPDEPGPEAYRLRFRYGLARRGRSGHRGRHRGRGGQAQDLHRPLSQAEEGRDGGEQHLVHLHHAPGLRDGPSRALHRHALHEPGADDAAGRADPRHRHRGRHLRHRPQLHREPGQEHRGVGGFPGLHRQPHPAADDQRGRLHAV